MSLIPPASAQPPYAAVASPPQASRLPPKSVRKPAASPSGGAVLAVVLTVIGWVVLVLGGGGILFLLHKTTDEGQFGESTFTSTAQVSILVQYGSLVVIAWAVCVGLGFAVNVLAQQSHPSGGVDPAT
jgi:hypothetical protein